MNTLFCYLYRDDDKEIHKELILDGEIEQSELISYLDDGEYFIPCQVGLPVLYGDFNSFIPTDHIWHEFLCIKSTDEFADDYDAQELLEAFKKASVEGWSIQNANSLDRYNEVSDINNFDNQDN